MTVSGPDFRQTWLWRQAFLMPRTDSTPDEQEFFKTQYLSLRDRAAQLVSRIAADLPGMTVHDISHLDALWDTASSVAEGAVPVNPAEAYVLGGSILLHDAAMSLAAYPGGVAEIRDEIAWRDTVARLALIAKERNQPEFNVNDPPMEIVQQVVPEVLRRLHAERAEVLAEQKWLAADKSDVYLIEDSDLRYFYGPTIGRIAHSHWWSVQKVEEEFSQDLGALANRTLNKVDPIKLACLLRIADALHLDSRRAPRFLRTITGPTGVSALHWAFQERLARPHIELDAVIFTAGQPFAREEAEAWWLAYDTLNAVDRELRDVDLLLQSRGREVLKARRVKGAGSPEMLARSVHTRGWRPVDARLQVSDVPRIVESLGGSKLYGDDPTVALRELIQNAADAVQARRRMQKRPGDWGLITVRLRKENDQTWLSVEDNGIGMSERVLTGSLLDFGTSFWRSPLALEEFPGLAAAGMNAIGRFGIGFFSIFMLGTVVRVYSRRFDKGQDDGRLLEFRGGTSSRPILSSAASHSLPMDGGTRVEVLLKVQPQDLGGLLHVSMYPARAISLQNLVGSVAPNIDVGIATQELDDLHSVCEPGDWLKVSEQDLVRRLNPTLENPEDGASKAEQALMLPLKDQAGQIFGRAFIAPAKYRYPPAGGWVTVRGLRAARLHNIQGILLGEALNAARDSAQPLVPREVLAQWATQQAELIAASIKDEVRQAQSAEVVLECGGTIRALRFINCGGTWLSESEFEEQLRDLSVLAVSFSGEFEYDEDADEVHPRDFRDHFEMSDDVAYVLRVDGEVLKTGNRSWPRSINAQANKGNYKIPAFTRELIRRTWGNDFSEEEEERAVGHVSGSDITRRVTVFRKGAAMDSFER